MVTIEHLVRDVLDSLQRSKIDAMSDEERLARVEELLARARARQAAGQPPLSAPPTLEQCQAWAEGYRQLVMRVQARRG